MNDKTEYSEWGARFNGFARVTAFVTLVMVLLPVQIFLLRQKNINIYRLPLFFHRLLSGILGFNVRTHGTMITGSSILYVANHTSYLDIPVLGGIVPASFVAKAEVASWPVFGYLSKLQQTVFIERKSSRAGEQSGGLRELLHQGRNLILFPEGTSTIGLSVLPFKSTLFSIAQYEEGAPPIRVQPISVCCTGLDGLPLTRDMRSDYAWYGDMTLVPHLWNVFKSGRFTVDVIFHEPLDPKNFKDRKQLAHACQTQVARGIEQCLTGRGIAALQAKAQIAHDGA